MTSDLLLRGIFVAALSSVGLTGCLLDCDPESTFTRPRLPPANPGGEGEPAFDPLEVTDGECDAICGIGFVDCTAVLLEDDTPAIECVVENDCSSGRRPRGLRRARVRGRDASAIWLSQSAHLEAASVHAFQSLAAELRGFGAPRALIERADKASEEERRHATLVSRLAQTRGATAPIPRMQRRPERSLTALAVENAVEGCVRETFAALLAHHQAQRAAAPDIRAAMRTIAPDETSHAALAADIDRWISPQLTVSATLRVQRARRRAANRLISHWRAAPEAVHELGLPDSERGRHLARSLGAALDW